MTVLLNTLWARNAPADPGDTIALKRALNRLGYYTPMGVTGITDIPDAPLFQSLALFQADHNLPQTGTIRPGDPTHAALNHALQVADTHASYVWHAVMDDHTRPAHAALNGSIRIWHDAPQPGSEPGCRCWAGPVPTDLSDPQLDAIHATISPLDFIGGAGVVKAGSTVIRTTTRQIASRFRKTDWITHAPREQLQRKFKHADVFGIKGNPSNKTIAAFKKALEDHIKSIDTTVIKGTFNKAPATHYYNARTRINVIQDSNGSFLSNWKLSDTQVFHLLKTGKLGGGKK